MGVSYCVTGLYNLLYLKNEKMNCEKFFVCSYIVSGEPNANLDMHMVKYGCNLLGPGTLKSALSQLKNKLMN